MVDISEFIKFHKLLTKNNPDYSPFYFPLNKDSKDPIEKISWKKNQHTFEQAKNKMKAGFNIGIAATDKDRLVIMDKDDMEKVGSSKPTLTVTSRKRVGEHSFYFTDDKVTKSIFDDSAKQNIATEECGEIRANWQYVVAAGSYVPVTEEELARISETDRVNAGKYTVSKEADISTITFDELPDVYKDALKEKRMSEFSIPKEKPLHTDRDNKSALYSLTIQDVTGKNETESKRFASLFHGSDTGKNTSISSKGLLHCWRHNVYHTPLTALAVIAKIGGCGSLGYSHSGRGTTSLDLNEGETVFKLWEYAKKNGLIPKDDPIPSKALVYFAIHQKVCDGSVVNDGWKLPTEAYGKALEILDKTSTPSGRLPLQQQDKENPVPENKICGTCIYRPAGGIGGCKNPQKDILQGKVKKKTFTIDKNPSCEKYQAKTKKIKEKIKTEIPPNAIRYHLSDLGNAQRLAETIKDEAKYCFPYKAWLIWDGKRWAEDETGKIKRFAINTIHNIYTEAENINDMDRRHALINFAMKSEAGKSFNAMIELACALEGLQINPDELDKNTSLFNVQNGTLDLKTGQIKPHDKKDKITKISPISYDPTATCPLWLDFLQTIFAGKQELINYIQLQAGYSLTGETKEEDFCIHYGTGGNGKSKFYNEIAYILGDYFIKARVETVLSSNKAQHGGAASEDVARLAGARLVTASEPERGAELREGMIKELTGRDQITARRLYQKSFTFIPEFKFWLITNHKPTIKGQDRGIWRRVKFIPFEVEISDDKIDINLDVKLKKESPGILNWMLEGCSKWQKNGMVTPQEVIDATADYKEDMDVLGEFFRTCCERDKTGITPNKWLFLTYRAWCNIYNIHPMSFKAFPRALEERGFKKLPKNDKGISFGRIRLIHQVLEIVSRAERDAIDMKNDELTIMTDGLMSFLKLPSRGELCINSSGSSGSSESMSIGTDNTKLTNILTNDESKYSSELQKQVVDALKLKYDWFNKPDSILDLGRLQKTMELYILNEIEGSEGIYIMRIIEDYCHIRGWC